MMGNALQTMASMQAQLDQITKLVEHQQRTIASLHARAGAKDSQVKRLTAGLQVAARLLGTESETLVKRAMITKRADEQNPAQPVPEPAPEAPVEGTVGAETPEAYADVRIPGMVPGSNQDVAADAVTTVYTPGQDVGTPPVKQLVDVTAPVDGTQSMRPLQETKTNVDVRAGNPMNPQTAFPLNGGFGVAQRTSAAGQPDDLRVMASIRLARLRLAMGTARGDVANGDDLTLGHTIASDQGLSMEAINAEIATLNGVRKAASAQRAPQPPRNAVPRAAGGAPRIIPPLGAQQGGFRTTAAAHSQEDADLSAALL